MDQTIEQQMHFSNVVGANFSTHTSTTLKITHFINIVYTTCIALENPSNRIYAIVGRPANFLQTADPNTCGCG